jgi:hypothetical protein
MKTFQHLAFGLLGSVVFGLVFFAIGFCGPLVVGLAMGSDPNMAPLWGFILGPLAAMVGFVTGCVWSLSGRRPWRQSLRIAVMVLLAIAIILIGIVIFLQASQGASWGALLGSAGMLILNGAVFFSIWNLKTAGPNHRSTGKA